MGDKRKHNDRGEQRRNFHDSDSFEQRPRTESKPLEWIEAANQKFGSVVLEATQAQGRDKMLFSFSISRLDPNTGKHSRHFRENDLADVQRALDEMRLFLQNAQSNNRAAG